MPKRTSFFPRNSSLQSHTGSTSCKSSKKALLQASHIDNSRPDTSWSNMRAGSRTLKRNTSRLSKHLTLVMVAKLVWVDGAFQGRPSTFQSLDMEISTKNGVWSLLEIMNSGLTKTMLVMSLLFQALGKMGSPKPDVGLRSQLEMLQKQVQKFFSFFFSLNFFQS